MTKSASVNWWETNCFILIASLLCAVPLLWPTVPPLTDVPGHIGRYAIQLDQAGEAAHQWYDFKWQLIGNLGVDLLMEPFGRLFGVELGAKLIIMAIPVLMAAGFLLVAREAHGRVPPLAIASLPLVYSYPMIFGFVNFMLSAALAFLAFALWLRLARAGKFKLRAALFVPLSVLLWVVHTYGFGLFGVLAFSAEVERHGKNGAPWWKAWFWSALHSLILCLPLILTIATRAQAGGMNTLGWFEWSWKARHLTGVLRESWQLWDVGSFLALVLLLSLTLLLSVRPSREGVRWSPTLLLGATLFGVLFLLFPYALFGSMLADMRLAPFVLATALLASPPVSGSTARSMRWVAFAGLALFLARTGSVTASFALDANRMEQALAGLSKIPREARLFSLVASPCADSWKRSKLDHLSGLALSRRHAFSNEQWGIAGAQLLTVPYLAGERWDEDGSQFAYPDGCSEGIHQIGEQIANFPRSAFDYLWIIDTQLGTKIDERGLKLLWSNGPDRMYWIVHTKR